MKFNEFLQMPPEIPLNEWQKIINQKNKLEKQTHRYLEKYYDYEDALKVCEDEKGSERWIKWETKLENILKKYNTALNELTKIKNRYNL